jgi:hypothetical protein
MPRTHIVQSVFDFAIREINALEGRIVTAENDADDMLWEQARQVVDQLEQGQTQRQLAAQWINARTGEPYSQSHVLWTKRTFEQFTNQTPRPRFRDAYNAIANGPVNRINFNSGDNEWYTPPAIIQAAREVLGAIDLDPSSCELANTNIQARQFYDLKANGLKFPWRGIVWMNPPYDQPAITQFSKKFAAHVRAGEITAGMVFVNNGTETEWFRAVADVSSAICFPSKRIARWSPDGETTSPLQGAAVLYAGPNWDTFVRRFESIGLVLVRPDLDREAAHG